jgi:hypothetical protein
MSWRKGGISRQSEGYWIFGTEAESQWKLPPFRSTVHSPLFSSLHLPPEPVLIFRVRMRGKCQSPWPNYTRITGFTVLITSWHINEFRRSRLNVSRLSERNFIIHKDSLWHQPRPSSKFWLYFNNENPNANRNSWHAECLWVLLTI